MDNQDNQFDVTTRIMETFFSYINDKNITSYVTAMKIAAEVEQYAEMKVKQFIENKEPKQEKIEEAAYQYAELYRCPATNENEYCKHDIISAFNNGAKYQAERMYSEEEVMNALHSVELKYNRDFTKIYEGMKEWFKQFKQQQNEIADLNEKA